MNASRLKGRPSAHAADFLPPERSARNTASPTLAAKTDVVDAEFEVLPKGMRPSSYRVFNDNDRSRRPVGRAVSVGGGSVRLLVAGLRLAEKILQRLPPRAFAVLVAFLCAVVFAVASGLSGAVQGVRPPTVEISGVSTTLGDANGMKVLSVYGNVDNNTREPREIPAVVVDVIAGGKRVSGTTIRPEPPRLDPGQSGNFAARLPHAGGKVPQVQVSFAPTGAQPD